MLKPKVKFPKNRRGLIPQNVSSEAAAVAAIKQVTSEHIRTLAPMCQCGGSLCNCHKASSLKGDMDSCPRTSVGHSVLLPQNVTSCDGCSKPAAATAIKQVPLEQKWPTLPNANTLTASATSKETSLRTDAASGSEAPAVRKMLLLHKASSLRTEVGYIPKHQYHSHQGSCSNTVSLRIYAASSSETTALLSPCGCRKARSLVMESDYRPKVFILRCPVPLLRSKFFQKTPKKGPKVTAVQHLLLQS
ncbi:hypothetical protein mRhiFer1_007859 [Rhinolophus ferrumequinum]|uniref:Uncharacterized protein n=1 Tax=Rhinolophus ferrumequinum TaxID=59479 RepID=A0A7J8AVN2_RHIFE|nr:hypothetical protein mRhiFer1_007859 [Rhinolophus ferrumequinum]